MAQKENLSKEAIGKAVGEVQKLSASFGNLIRSLGIDLKGVN